VCKKTQHKTTDQLEAINRARKTFGFKKQDSRGEKLDSLLSLMDGISTARPPTIQARTLRSYFGKKNIYWRSVLLILIRNYYLSYCPMSSDINIFVAQMLVSWRNYGDV